MKKTYLLAAIALVALVAGFAHAAPDLYQTAAHSLGFLPATSDLSMLGFGLAGMAGMSPAQARVVDPVLSSVAQGYQNSQFVGDALFPRVPVGLRGGRIITFGKEDFMLYGTARAPGENTKRVQFGHTDSQYSLADFSLEGQVPIEVLQEGQNGPGIDHGAMAVDKTSAIMALRLEKAQADLARNTSNYGSGNKITLSGTAQWSDFTGTSDPIATVETGKEAVRTATGKRPNTVVMGALVWSKLKQHPKVVDRMKYTGRDVPTAEIIAALFEVERVLIGDSIYASDVGAFTDVWGKDVVLAYTVPRSLAAMGAPTYGYTYNLNGYPIVEEPYYDRNTKSWVYPVTRAEQAVIAAASAGYLITNAVA